jgi:hypothetical protein
MPVNDDPLVPPEWLTDHLEDDDLVLIQIAR